MRPFRVLFVDDVTADALEESDGDLTFSWTSDNQRPWILNQLLEMSRQPGANIHAYFSRDLLFEEHPVHVITTNTPAWKEDFLWALDVLILDLKGVSIREEWELTQSDLPASSLKDINTLNHVYEGAAFYHKNRERLKTCQAIIFLTQFDNPTPPEVVTYVDSQCTPESVPWTVKYPINRRGINSVVNIINALHQDFTEGYTQLESRGAIEFAASHDMPVLIVGESGTGKEYIAHAIHRRWAQEKRRRGLYIPDKPTVVNCAGLTSGLARGELFGHVRGSYTGADNHRIGAILTACGCSEIISTSRNNFVEEYRRRLLAQTDRNAQPLLERQGDDLSFLREELSSTLFLDEFGDLPPDVQTLLLRYLQSFDVQPFGYPGRILNAKLRIIAATSDPRVAMLAGEELQGGWRSDFDIMKGLREDLIFRVKNQVIRAEPVTADNVRDCLLHFINRYECADIWDDSAINHIVNTIRKQLDPSNKQGKGSPQIPRTIKLPAFGHRREIDRIVRLANAFVHGAQERGLRISKVVTEEIVRKVWKPSHILAHNAEPIYKSVESQTASTEVVSKTEEQSSERVLKLRHRIAALLREGFWKDCPDDFSRNAVLSKFEDQYGDVESARKELCLAYLKSTLFHIPGEDHFQFGELDQAWGAKQGDNSTVRNYLKPIRETAIKELLSSMLDETELTASIERITSNNKWWGNAASEMRKTYRTELSNFEIR